MANDSALTRRQFLQFGGVALAGLALTTAWRSLPEPSFPPLQAAAVHWDDQEPPELGMRGRITRPNVPVYAQPDPTSPRLAKLPQDTLLDLLEVVISPVEPEPPAPNPRWYQVMVAAQFAYLHSAHVQRVDAAHLNPPLQTLPPGGLLGEVTVPFTQTEYQTRRGYWIPLYRLYYTSVHWITGLDTAPDGTLRYRLTDEWLRVHYWAPATHLRPLTSEEISPLAPEIPPMAKRIEVSLQAQTFTAYENNTLVRQGPVSTGLRYMETPAGEFHLNRKFPSKHMGAGGLTSDPRAYELVGVPWASFFTDTGVAFHGTFWHDNFGTPTSHGCVNLRTEDAQWLFRWTTPAYAPLASDPIPWKVAAQEGTVVVVS